MWLISKEVKDVIIGGKKFRSAIALSALIFILAQQCVAADPAVVLPVGARNWFI